ncbi:MoaD/ThiS family protein [bacterium]|nr:MoaD/ThiS family protein [bacterium]
MKAEIRLFASFKKYLPDFAEGQKVIMELEEGTTIRTILQQFGVPIQSVKLVFVNSVRAELEDIIRDGDRIGVFPPVAGG